MPEAADGTAADDDLVDAYWTHHRLVTSNDHSERIRAEEWFWAWERVHGLVAETAAAALPLVIRLCDASPDDAVGYIGAGPIEELLMLHGASVVDAMADAAPNNPNFARELSRIYQPRNLSKHDLERLRRSIEPL